MAFIPVASNPNESPMPVWGLALLIAGPIAALVVVFVVLRLRDLLRVGDLWFFAWLKRRRK